MFNLFGLFEKKVKFVLKEGGTLPEYKSKAAACCDCYANESKEIFPGERNLVKLGFCIQLPKGYEAVIRSRSGMSKNAIDVATGTIDADYRGEVSANIINNSHSVIHVRRGERICQMKIQKAETFAFVCVDRLDETERGEGGFGHTGK